MTQSPQEIADGLSEAIKHSRIAKIVMSPEYYTAILKQIKPDFEFSKPRAVLPFMGIPVLISEYCPDWDALNDKGQSLRLILKEQSE